MNDRNCEVIRRELDETALNDDFSATAANHLQTCAECREFQRQHTKLREIVGSLGTVNAPADFDFRLRARLAADANKPGFRFWTVTVRGLATAAVLVVFGVGAVMIWQRTQTPPATTTVAVAPPQQPAQPSQITEPPRREDGNQLGNPGASGHEPIRAIAGNTPPRRIDRQPAPKQKQPITAVDFSKEGATVVSNARPTTDTVTVFPIEASLQSLKVSLDDGRGNARTISFPTVSFGSQRVLTNQNQLAPKGGVW
jgi:hypothetical protein